ncbi:MAG: hypothetical protein ACRD08_18975 [Acidimicrobiales bacterium]
MATPTSPVPELVHLVEVESHSPFDDAYAAACSCGWVGDIQREAEWAHADAVEHRDQAPGPGDGLDAVMGELLDVQDDLAAMVVWLAENWSAGLPVPTVYGRGGGAGGLGPAMVELSAYCTDPADLTRIAHLLGVSPSDDDEPNPHSGARYRNVCRSFGRVTLRAFTPITSDTEPAP